MWGFDDEWDACGLFPDGAFAPVFLFAEVPAVVADEHDDSFALTGVIFECVEEAADLLIDECDGGEVGLDGEFPLFVGDDEFVVGETVVHAFVGV